MKNSNNDILLTGIPRSGTTLICALLNRTPDCVALNEPMNVGALLQAADADGRIGVIEAFFQEQRTSILEEKTALARITTGLLDDNTFQHELDEKGLRKSSLALNKVRVDKNLDEDFNLVVKHPNVLTAMLDEIVDRFICFAVIRHPVSVLASWNTLPIALRDGHAPMAEKLDRVLQTDLERCGDRWERQVRLLDWYYERYSALLPPERIIRYEEVIATGGRALKVIDPAASGLDQRLENRNASPLYDPGVVSRVAAALKSHGAAWRKFYDDV